MYASKSGSRKIIDSDSCGLQASLLIVRLLDFKDQICNHYRFSVGMLFELLFKSSYSCLLFWKRNA